MRCDDVLTQRKESTYLKINPASCCEIFQNIEIIKNKIITKEI